MAVFGRFIDIGKKHFVNNAHLELSPFDKSITYSSVDLSLLIEHRGRYVQKLMSDVVELLNSGVLRPPAPVHRVPIANVQTAFRTMQSGKSMGKIVTVNDDSSTITAPIQLNSRSVVRRDASYLITGGTGGLGRALTRWLVEMGAKHVVLVSRSGGDMTPASPLSQLIIWATDRGAQVYVTACDISKRSEVESLISGLGTRRIPLLAGVIHGAMVLKVRTKLVKPGLFDCLCSSSNMAM
jgi:hypothetical protein